MFVEMGQIVDLARDPSTTARGHLLTNLARMVLLDDACGCCEREIFFDIVRSVIGHVSCEDRCRLAELAADLDEFPCDLLMSLAHDEIAVAKSILVRSRMFGDDELIAIASDCSGEHRAAIALRRLLSRRVAHLLIELGGVLVLRRLGANRGADLGDDDLRELLRHSEHDTTLRDILGMRDDLREAFLRLARSATASGEDRGESETERRQAQENPGVTALIEKVRRGETSLDEVVTELCDGDRQADLACFLGRMTSIDESDVMRLLLRSDGAGIALLAGGIEIGEAAFDHVVDLRRRRLRFSKSQVRWEREAYHDLDRADARSTIDNLGKRRRSAA